MSPAVFQQPLTQFTDRYASVDELLMHLLHQGVLETRYNQHHQENEIEISIESFTPEELEILTNSPENKKLDATIERIF